MKTQDIFIDQEKISQKQENSNIPILNVDSEMEIGYNEDWNNRL